MKRIIKFKAQRLDGKGWVVGYYTTAEDCVYKSISHYIIVKGVISYGVQWERYTVKPETVCQFTGLTDKDGKEIFEGDIVTFDRGIGNWAGKRMKTEHEVYFESNICAFAMKSIGSYIKLRSLPNRYIYEVIGNIHDL